MATERVVGIAAVKDEADVIEATVRLMATQVDALIVADNASTDGTYELLLDIARDLPLTVLQDPEVGYYQSRRMSALAARAVDEEGSTWVVPWDADEVWYSPFGRIGDVLDERPEAIVTAALYDHVATGADPEGDPVSRMSWRRREAAPLPKVACRPSLPVTIHQGNHGASFPEASTVEGLIVVRHYPYRSAEQFIRKARNGAAAYAATDLPEDQGSHWRGYGRILEEHGEDALADVFREHFWHADPSSDPSLIFDPCPAW